MWPSTSSSSSSSQFLQDFHTRRLLLHNPLHASPAKALAGDTMVAAPPSSSTGSQHHPSDPYMGQSSFDSNIVMILSVLLCALICALGLNSIIRCALRCSSQQGALESGNSPSTALPARLANTGIKKKALKTFPTMTYSAGLKMPGLDSECIICLSEFAPGERLRFLPKCNHGFHVRCIDKWLMAHSSCPTCRHCLMETCQKIVGCSSQASSSDEGTLPAPLEPEGLIRDYRGIY